MRRSIGAFLALVMVLALTGTAWATPADTVTVGGVELNDTNRYATTDDNGTVTLATGTDYNIAFTPGDANTPATLTLNNANITVLYGIGIEAEGDLTIKLIGTNTVDNGEPNGICVDGGNLTIVDGDGSGTLRAKSDVYGIHVVGGSLTIKSGTVKVSGSDGIHSDAVTIEGGTVTATSDDAGIYADDVIITGGKVTANGDDGIRADGTINITGGTVNATGDGYNGIRAGTVTITGGTVTAKGNGESSDGVGLQANSLSITGGAVEVEGEYTGIESGTITITGGTVTVTGGTLGIYASSINISDDPATAGTTKLTATGGTEGMNAYRISISGDADVNVSGRMYGMYADKDISISGGTVTATGGQYGLFLCDDPAASITITGGLVKAKGGEAAFSKAPLVNGVADNSVLGKKEVQIGKASPSGSGSRRPSSGDDKALSPNTFDAGIGMSVVSLVLSATGAAWISRKKD